MTFHYQLDWLSSFNLKALINFLKHRNEYQNLAQATEQINSAMKDVMHGRALIWGIKDYQAPTCLGIVNLNGFNNHQLSLQIQTDPHFKAQINTREIVKRITELARESFHLEVTPIHID